MSQKNNFAVDSRDRKAVWVTGRVKQQITAIARSRGLSEGVCLGFIIQREFKEMKAQMKAARKVAV